MTAKDGANAVPGCNFRVVGQDISKNDAKMITLAQGTDLWKCPQV